MELDDITYSREATIAAVADYYTFLTRMYMDEFFVVYPPPGGWPEIVNAEPALLQSLGMSDEVLALLAHLPYIQYPRYPNCREDAPEPISHQVFANWPALFRSHSNRVMPDGDGPGYLLRLYTEGVDFAHISTPHVVSLTIASTVVSATFIVDTELGIIHWAGCDNRIERGEWQASTVDWDLDDEVSEEEADWRNNAPAWAIPDFFEVLKDQFRQLHWAPISHCTVRSVVEGEYHGEDGMMSMLVDLYRQHGWPDSSVYRKEDCIAAVMKAMSDKYPESACHREL